MSCNIRQTSTCLVQGDKRIFSWTLKTKSTGTGVSLAGSTFDFKLRKNSFDGEVVLNWTSSGNPTKFDVTSISSGIVRLILETADTDALDPTLTYYGQFRQILSGQVTTFTFFTFEVRAKL